MPPDDADPPRKFYGFKAPDFERLNAVPGDNPPSVPPPAAPAPPAPSSGRIDVHDLARAAQTPGSPLGSNAVGNRPNEVHGFLRLNSERETAAGLYRVPPMPKRRSRRKRDYWLMMGCGNTVLGTLALLAGPRNPILFVYAIGGVGVFSAAVTWVMWQVMDDY